MRRIPCFMARRLGRWSAQVKKTLSVPGPRRGHAAKRPPADPTTTQSSGYARANALFPVGLGHAFDPLVLFCADFVSVLWVVTQAQRSTRLTTAFA